MGFPATGEPTDEGGVMGEEWISEEKAAERDGVDGTGGVIEAIDGAGADEAGDGGDDGGGGFGGGVVGESRWGEVGDVAEEKAVDGAVRGGEALDDGG